MDTTICAICQELTIELEHQYIIPECGHIFHTKCALEWYRISAADVGCPICRSQCQSFSSKKYKTKLYKKISKRKSCPKIIRDKCAKIILCDKNIRVCKKYHTEHKILHKEIFKEDTKRRKNISKYEHKKLQIMSELDSIPVLILIQQLGGII